MTTFHMIRTMLEAATPHAWQRHGLVAVLLAGLAMSAAAQSPESPAPNSVPAGYRLVWSDEFDRDGHPDPAKWVHDTGRNKEGWYNNELQYYAGPRLENARVEGGRLIITARHETLRDRPDWGGQRYTSARLITRGKADWTYGFFEIRAKMPCGGGTWPAIWLVGSGGRWPDDGELDIMEHQGHRPERVSSAVHMRAGHGGDNVGGATRLPDACKAFHNYQLHWTPTGTWFSVDGMVHLHYPNLKAGWRSWPFDRPQFLILNLALGGDLGGPIDDAALPVAMEVEYVRVYQRPAKP